MSESKNVRAKVAQLAEAQGKSLSELSLLIVRNGAYLGQFVNRGTPRRLPEDERRHLAVALAVDERELGAREPWGPIT